MSDVIVVGGGLAGTHAAITLAQRGQHVVLLEAEKYPRHKVCGEFLSPECAALFAETGFLERLDALKPAMIRTLRLTAPSGVAWRSAFPAVAFGVSRYALDAALAVYAGEQGVEVCDGTRVTEVSGSLRDGFTVTARGERGNLSFQARSVISAHGKRSNLDRALNRAFLRQSQPYIGLKRHFAGPALPGHIDLHIFGGGYCGMSQVEGGATNVCLLVRQDVFQRAAQGDPEQFIRWMHEQNPALGAWLAQAAPLLPEWLSIGQVPFVPKTLLEGDVLMAGDAAGMIAPLAGDGMAMALHSGKLAADALALYLEGKLGAEAAKQQYVGAWKRHFKGRLQLGRVLQAIMLRPALLTPGLRLMNLLPVLGNLLLTQTRDLSLVER